MPSRAGANPIERYGELERSPTVGGADSCPRIRLLSCLTNDKAPTRHRAQPREPPGELGALPAPRQKDRDLHIALATVRSTNRKVGAIE